MYEAYRQALPQLFFMWALGIQTQCHACMAGTLPMEPLFQPRLYEKNFYCMNSACQLKTLSEALCADPNVWFPQGMVAELLENQEACLRRGLAPLVIAVLNPDQESSYDCTSEVCICTTDLVAELCQAGLLAARVDGRQPANQHRSQRRNYNSSQPVWVE